MMPALWSLCDISLVSLRDTPLFSKVIPSKIFESMAMGLPMIIFCPPGEATQIIGDANAGLIVEPENPEALAEAILTLYDSPSRLQDLSQACQSVETVQS